jgi:AcrR family transcriptional regulator
VAEPTLRAQQVEATRRAIVTSARRLFGAHGYASTSVDDIARDARVTKGAIYHHFDTKEELFRAVYIAVEADAQAHTSNRKLAADATPIDLIVHGMHGYLDAALDPEVQRVTLIDAPAVLGTDPDGPTEEQPNFKALREFIAAAIRAGSIAPLDPDALTQLISGTCLQAGLVIARSTNQRRARQRVGAALEAMIRGLSPT